MREYFDRSGKRTDGGARLVVKSVFILAWLVASYLALVFWASNWWQVSISALSIILAVAGVGFNIQHDGGHGAYARKKRWNKVSAWALDLVGGSSYVWYFKHTITHHHYTNIEGVDEDIDAAPWLRLTPLQPRKFYHRFQHFYAWLLFGFLQPKWAFFDDFATMLRRRIGRTKLPKPRRRDVTLLLLGKAVFFGWVFAIPLLVGHSLGMVLGVYAICGTATGVVISIVFQLAHCVEEVQFPTAPAAGEKVELPWVEHQLATTMDFAPRNRLLTWYLGGLNFQVEHHLFPRVSHVHYPALAPIVRDVCREHGVPHITHQRF